MFFKVRSKICWIFSSKLARYHKRLIPDLTMEDDSKKIRQEKEFKSFCKKVRQNSLIWFDALSKTKKYDLFYEWKQAKYDSVEKKTTCIRDWGMKTHDLPTSP